MSEPQPSEMRVGDAEREQALQALGDHMAAGRLDIDEYGDRTARVAAAKTRGELTELFRDLPDPRPTFDRPVQVQPAPMPAPQRGRPEPVTNWENRPLAQRAYAGLVPLSWVFAVVLFLFAFRTPVVFAVPVIITVLGGSMWGHDWSRDRKHWEREQRNRRRRRWDDY
ncbi:MAG: DUF1707 domain-containing protein [Kibdelosporangium sp.]